MSCKHASFILTLYFTINLNVLGQISIPGKPYTLYYKESFGGRLSDFSGSVYVLPSLDNAQEIMAAEKYKVACPTCRRDYYGKGIDVTVDIKKNATEFQVEDGKIWKFTFESKTALGMQFYFSRYKLPKKANLFIYNEDFTEILGAYTHANNHKDEKFAIEIIDGQKITLEYFEANDAEFSGDLEIDKVVHVFKHNSTKDLTGGRIGDGATCNLDIKCPDGNPYRNERKAVCRISYYDPEPNLTAHCSGFLINNNQFIRKPYVLTADHCIKTNDPTSATTPQARHHEWIFEFDYENSSCSPGGIEPITHSVQGATLVTRGVEADYALLDLQVNNLESWVDVTYLGWDIRNINFTSTASIHHPEGDVKKISLDYNSVIPVYAQNTSSSFCCANPSGFPKTHWKVTWDKGITEFGSSGSPLINQGSRMAIGVLSAGSSSCSSGGPDYYGRLAHAWNTYDPPYFYPLGHYLDPNNTTQILSSYIPNPEATEGSSEGGGGTGGFQLGDVPVWTGVLLNPTHLLGGFSDLDDKAELCSGNYNWKVAHGDPIVSSKKYIQLLSEYHSLSNRYASAITTNFQFAAGKEYTLSFEVFDPHTGFPSTDFLEAYIGTNIISYGCVTNRFSMSFAGQKILTLDYNKYKNSNGDSKWYTFAIKFISSENYNNLYIRHVPKGPISSIESYSYASALIDRIGIHEKGDFNNPQCVDNKTFNSSSFSNKEMANVSITAIKGTSTSPVVINTRNVKFISKSISLKDGFRVERGATFLAQPNDCIDVTTHDNPIGPLDFDVVSNLRSNDNPESAHYTADYSHLLNLYYYTEGESLNPTSHVKIGVITLTPNPTSKSVVVSCETFGIEYDVALKDIRGRVIFRTKASKGYVEIDVGSFAKGVYIVEVRKGQIVYYERLVIS